MRSVHRNPQRDLPLVNVLLRSVAQAPKGEGRGCLVWDLACSECYWDGNPPDSHRCTDDPGFGDDVARTVEGYDPAVEVPVIVTYLDGSAHPITRLAVVPLP